ncbi:MAG: DUF418 domain-containing protein [bacterium]|nr:DUF418 domain-containing protein [bacterium]
MTTGPTVSRERVVALDVLRGVAIFGILVVNVLQMFIPEYLANDPTPVIPGESGMWLAWFITDAVFENKFITVFSMLFGAGFCLQWIRAEDTRRFRWTYLRRVVVLMLFGLAHGLLFYWADVLVIYALAAIGLLMFKSRSARRMLWVGGILLVLMMGWGAYISSPGRHVAEKPGAQLGVAEAMKGMRNGGPITVDLEQLPEREPGLRWFSGEDHGRVRGDGIYDLPMPANVAILVLDGNNSVEQSKVEYAVFSKGPVRAALFGRLSYFSALLILYMPFYLGWRTLALFLLAAGMVKWGYLDGGKELLWRRVAIVGFAVGVPITLAASVMRGYAHSHAGDLANVGNIFHDVSSLVLAGALGSAVLLWCRKGLGGALQRGLSAVGRTALTNYIGQSVMMSLVATSYGLGLFGDLTRLQLLALSAICFSLQLVLSSLWLKAFRFGPLEWLWRCATYWRFLPIRTETRDH